MNDALIAMRTIHLAATAVTAGAVVFLVLVASPAWRAAADLAASGYRRRILRMAAVGLTVAVLSGAARVVLEAASMSGRPLAATFTEGTLWTVLTRTTFGVTADVWTALAISLAACLAFLGTRRWATWIAPLLAASLLGALAWSGHAAATDGLDGHLHLAADALHLIAAGTWLGSLVALAVLLATACRHSDPAWRDIAAAATLRFSMLGIASVTTLLGSGIVNAWFLAGSLPALLGTAYGRLLLIKIALFGAMVSVAAANRLRLTPRLAHSLSSEDHGKALRQLTRNTLIEVALGLIVLVIVGALGTLPPGIHVQPTWPLPFRFSAEILDHPLLGRPVLIAMAATALGAALAVWGLFRRRLRWPMMIAGAVIVAYFGRDLGALSTEAYPTSFYMSPTGYSASSIARGGRLFAQHCSSCHGRAGGGDGPAALDAKVKPPDLVSGHIYAHPVGDLFWWITRGIGDAMPGFAAILDEDARWSLIDFLYANADGSRLAAFAGTVGRAGYPAPGFSAQCPDGSTVTLDDLRGRVVHLIVPGAGSPDVLNGLSERAGMADVTTILVARDASPRPDPAICVADDANLAQVLATYRGHDRIAGTELLIDHGGALRALWHPGVRRPRWTELESFRREVERMRRTPAVQRSAASHLHR